MTSRDGLLTLQEKRELRIKLHFSIMRGISARQMARMNATPTNKTSIDLATITKLPGSYGRNILPDRIVMYSYRKNGKDEESTPTRGKSQQGTKGGQSRQILSDKPWL